MPKQKSTPEQPGNPAALLDGHQETLTAFAGRLAEVGAVVLENVLSRPATVQEHALSATTYEDLRAEFGEVRHVAVEVRTALSESEAYLSAILCPLDQAAALLGRDLSPEALADAETATKEAAAVARTAREIADLVTLMLFTDTTEKAEIGAADARFDGLEETLGVLQDVSSGSPVLRLDVTLAPDGGDPVRITHVLPQSFLTRLAEALTPSDPDDEAQPEQAAGAGPSPQAAQETSTVTRDDQVAVHPAQFASFAQGGADGSDRPGKGNGFDLGLILDVSLRITVELGRSSMSVQEILSLGPGSVIELDKTAGEPVDILVNDRLIARGEVVVVDENFGVRVTEIVSPKSRAAALR